MSASGQPFIEVKGLRYFRGNRLIFDGIDVAIQRGKITAIMGPSGSGKTTLLKLIGGQLKALSGEIVVDGRRVGDLSRDALFELRKKMGMLFQNGALLTDLSVFENVAFPLREHTELPESIIRTLVLMKLEAVGLRGARDLFPRQLSGGMARRVALARAVAMDPQIAMYDEPFSGQDPMTMGVLVQLIKHLNDALNLTSIVVSHDVPETSSIADYIYIIAGGKIVGEGTPAQLRRSESPWVEQFMGGKPDGPVPFHYAAADLHDDLFDGIKP